MAFVSPSELPDYRPAFSNGSVRADAEGKLWVRIMSPKPASGPEYDVIDRTGKLVDRVVLPAGTTIVGFGAGGVVYLGVRDAAGVARRARAGEVAAVRCRVPRVRMTSTHPPRRFPG